MEALIRTLKALFNLLAASPSDDTTAAALSLLRVITARFTLEVNAQANPKTVFTTVVSSLLSPLLVFTSQGLGQHDEVLNSLLPALHNVLFHTEHEVHWKALLLSDGIKPQGVKLSYLSLLFTTLSNMVNLKKEGTPEKTAAVLAWLPRALDAFLTAQPQDTEGPTEAEPAKKKQKTTPKLGSKFSFFVELLHVTVLGVDETLDATENGSQPATELLTCVGSLLSTLRRFELYTPGGSAGQEMRKQLVRCGGMIMQVLRKQGRFQLRPNPNPNPNCFGNKVAFVVKTPRLSWSASCLTTLS